MCSGGRNTAGQAVLSLLAGLLALGAGDTLPARAEESFWLRAGGRVVATCPGAQTGMPLKVAMTDAGGWLLANGVVMCTDTGDTYTYTFKFLRIAINPRSRRSINRERVRLEFLGMAVYRGTEGGQRVEYLAEPVLPIDAILPVSSSDPIYIGNLAFNIPKSALASATRITFYLTAQNVLFPFGFL